MVQTRSNVPTTSHVGDEEIAPRSGNGTGGIASTPDVVQALFGLGVTTEQLQAAVAALSAMGGNVPGAGAGKAPLGHHTEHAATSQHKGKKTRRSRRRPGKGPMIEEVLVEDVLEGEDDESSECRVSAFKRLGGEETRVVSDVRSARLERTEGQRDERTQHRQSPTRTEKTKVPERDMAELARKIAELKHRVEMRSPYSQPILRTVTPFTPRVMSVPLPENFRPWQIKAYSGTTDPQDHLSKFYASMEAAAAPDEVKCRCFLATLEGSACNWFNRLPKGTIDDWDTLAEKFLTHFAANRRQRLPYSHLLNICIRKGEKVRDFIVWWEKEARDMHGADDQALVAMFQAALPRGEVRKELCKNPPPTYQETLARAKFLASEEFDDAPDSEAAPANGAKGNIGGDSVAQRKRWKYMAFVAKINQAPAPKLKRREQIQFTEKDLLNTPSPHRDALVVKIEINNAIVHHTLVDTGSSVNIMYEKTFQDLGLNRKDLRPVRTPLSGFTGDSIEAEGVIAVPVIVGDGAHKAKLKMEFMVVSINCAHNMILGRPGLEDLECVISPYYLCMKFPTPSGTGVARGDQKLARSCYVRITKKLPRDETLVVHAQEEMRKLEAEPTEEVEEVPLDPQIPERKVKVGASLTTSQRRRLVDVFAAYRVIFAWGPGDMPGVDPKIICHRLAVNPESRPVKQKKRFLSSERREFVSKEVTTLQSIGHIREVKHPEWMANVFGGRINSAGHVFNRAAVDALLPSSPGPGLSQQPMGALLRSPNAPSRMSKWAVFLGAFQIEFKPRPAIKGQALSDFVVECTAREDPSPELEADDWWTVFTDGSSAAKNSGGRVVVIAPEGFRAYYSVQFGFKASNNEALLCGLRLAAGMNATKLRIKCDSKLEDERMKKYRDTALELLKSFTAYSVEQIPRAENVEELSEPSIHAFPVAMICAQPRDWTDDIVAFLKDGTLLDESMKAKLVRTRAPGYTLEGEKLYKRAYNGPLLKCLRPAEAKQVMEEVHAGICSAHQGAYAVSRKITLQGYFWPTIVKDYAEFVKKCKVCQEFQKVPGRPSTNYTPISTAILFARWGLDLVGALPRGTGNVRYVIVAIDYFTKWVEAAPLASITGAQCQKFLAKQVENANRTIVHGLKRKLEACGGEWAEELPYILWTYRTTPRRATGETPFALCYGFEARAPAEISIATHREKIFDPERNEEALAAELHLVHERREAAFIRAENYRRKVKSYHDGRVRARGFIEGEWVLRKRPVSRPLEGGKFAKNYEGLYIIKEVVGPSTFRLETPSGGDVPRT
ncbi:unnamed protein product [Cuscuta campestris]|uniref:RNase H type-1 domain-containing protein n=1 Tax=Cuscuta campestris TaxID=132261 RepID=A0A484KAJ2_9ASTE|nr:unnamed protein product [Cuscuta campestris]